jgi:hypothetical protein
LKNATLPALCDADRNLLLEIVNTLDMAAHDLNTATDSRPLGLVAERIGQARRTLIDRVAAPSAAPPEVNEAIRRQVSDWMEDHADQYLKPNRLSRSALGLGRAASRAFPQVPVAEIATLAEWVANPPTVAMG